MKSGAALLVSCAACWLLLVGTEVTTDTERRPGARVYTCRQLRLVAVSISDLRGLCLQATPPGC